MKKLIIIIGGLLFGGYPDFIYSQVNSQQVVISPFIGDTLDRVEREYFGLFPDIKGFQKAVWYLNSDSSLTVTVKIREEDKFIDTTFVSSHSISKLRRRIDGIIGKDLIDEKVKSMEIKTNDSVYNGIIYSYRNNKLALIQDCCSDNKFPINLNLKRPIHTNEIRTVSTSETSFFITLLTTFLGAIGFSVIGLNTAPEETVQERRIHYVYNSLGDWYPEEYFETKVVKNRSGVIYWGIAGAALGYFIGQLITFPVEYGMTDPDAKELIRKNSLLPGGIGSDY